MKKSLKNIADEGFPYTAFILEQMCMKVNANPDNIDFGKQDWFHSFEWYEEQEEEFIEWLADYLYNNKEARKELLRFPSRSKKVMRRAAEQFVFNYGWKLKQKPE